eukprot:jgi/Ulvmu1/3953/UM018_0176.1
MQRLPVTHLLDSDDHAISSELRRLPALPCSTIAIMGAKRTGRQSLCMHMAWASARGGQSVLFLSCKSRMTRSRLLLPASATAGDKAWSMVKMRYLCGRQEFIKYVCSIHALPDSSVPDLVIVDDDADFLTASDSSSDGHERALAASVAVLKDGIEHLQARTDKAIQLVLSVPHKTQVPLYILWRWISAAIELNLVTSAPRPSATLPAGAGPMCCMTVTPGPQLRLPAALQQLCAWYRPHDTTLRCVGITYQDNPGSNHRQGR